MKASFLVIAMVVLGAGWSRAADIAIPDKDIELIKTTDYVQVSGTNDLSGVEKFDIHDIKAIREFIRLITSDRYTPVPKSLQPKFKSPSAYKVRLFSNGAPVLDFKVIADSILDLPDDPMFYMESDSYSANLMAPLLRLR